MARVVIFGTGDAGELAEYYFRTDSEHEVVAFVVDPGYRVAETFCGLPVVETPQLAARFPPDSHALFVALGYSGMNRVRAQKYREAQDRGYQLVSYVSSRCTYLTNQQPGPNCFILEDNTIQPFVRIGSNVTLWSGNHIGHHSVIEDHCFLTSQVVVSGRVHIGPYCFLGVNATLRNNIRLAAETLVGAGAVVMKDTVEKGVYLPPRAELFAKKSDEIEI